MSLSGKIIPKLPLPACLQFLVTVLLLSLPNVHCTAQQNTIPPTTQTDTLKLADLKTRADSLKADTTVKDTVAKKSLEDSLGIRISKDALPSVVTSQATDSAVLDMKENIFSLYGNANVKYEDMTLDAGKIIYMQSHNLVTATYLVDTVVALKNRPSFTQGQEKFTYDSLQYNFKSKKAIVRNAHSQYGDGYVHSTQVKRNPDQSIYGLHNIYTTCALDTPHFGIAAKKIKVIPNRVAASGPANLNVERVPTPLFLPFGLFPISKEQKSGIKLPTYTLEDQRGLGLREGGYYFSISQYLDFLLLADIYSKGSWNTGFVSNYRNRYHYNGNLSFSYAYNKTGETFEPDASITKDFKIRWLHQSDPKSRPGVGFNASVDVGTSTYNQNNTYTATQILQNQYTSSISYSKDWQNKPHKLTVAARHSQNVQSRRVDVTLPDLNFSTQFNPFQQKNSVGDKWFEKITIPYTFNAVNQTWFYDSLFSLNNLSLNDFQNGMVHNIPINASYNVLRFINMAVSSTYKEYWLTQRMYRFYNNNIGREDTNLYRGFYTARDFNASLQLSTRIYGLKMFKKGKIAGLRHVLTPNIGFTYTPDFAAAPFRYGYRTKLNPEDVQYVYKPVYEGSVPGVPGHNQFGDFSSAINFGLGNNFQMKVRTDKDTSGFKNIRLIDNFMVTGAYDIAKDSFNWAPFAMSFTNNILNLVNISASAAFDPYPLDTTGMRMKKTLWDEGDGLVRFTNATIGVDGGFQSKPKEKPAVKSAEAERLLQYGQYNDYVDFNIPWNVRFQYSMTITKSYIRASHKDTVSFNHYIGFNGDFNVTPRWKFAINSGYNFTEKQLAFTSVSILRDLHCWQMALNAFPFGDRKGFNFTLNVKAPILQDLKLIRRRDYRDAVN
jgi:hypothetical protein